MEILSTLIVPAIVGALVSFIGSLINNSWNARSKIDESLRLDRAAAYKVVWGLTELLPQWPRASGVTYKDLYDLSCRLRDWYFQQGGMYMSTQARDAYGTLQKTLNQIARGKEGNISDADYDVAREDCSRFRTQLTGDLLSRNRALLLS